MKKLFLIILLLGLFYFPQIILATPTPTKDDKGDITLWKYTSENPGHLKAERGIIIPNNTLDIKTIYVYFHGNDGPSVDSMCAGGYSLCKDAAQLKNAAILIPTTDRPTNATELSKADIDKFINEAKDVITNKIHATISENNYIVMGHSGGGEFVGKFLAAGYTAQATILFDACYGGCISRIAPLSNTGHIYYYYQGNETTEKDSTASYNLKPEKSTLIKTSAGHGAVVSACFTDHLTPNNCSGTAISTSGSAETTATKITSGASYDEVKDIVSQPDVQINIPGLKFTDKDAIAKSLYETETGTYMSIPYLGEYISALYKYLIAIAGILAVVMIIKYGFDLVMSGGEAEKINNSKKGIAQILIGLLIAVFSYVLLYTINPNFVSLKSLQIKYVPEKYLNAEEHEMMTPETYNLPGVRAQNATYNIQKPSWSYQTFDCNKKDTYPPMGAADPKTLAPFMIRDCPGLIGSSGALIKPLADALCKAGQSIKDTEYKIRVGSTYRSFEDQVKLWCAPERQSIPPIERRNRVAVPGFSNHGQGRAVDIFLVKNGETLFDSNYDKQCEVDESYIKKIAKIMYDADPNVVRLSTEIWHFEYGTNDNKIHAQFLTKPVQCK